MDDIIENEWVPTPLPRVDMSDFTHAPTILSAYDVCLRFERDVGEKLKAAGGEELNPKLVRKLIHARILGYILLYIPSELSKANIAVQIHSCDIYDNQYDKLDELGGLFETGFILPFRKNKPKTSTTTDHPSRPPHDEKRKEIIDDVREAPRNHAQAKKRALIRDGYQCPITGIYDSLAITNKVAPYKVIKAAGTIDTQCAHIIPESTCFDVGSPENEAKRTYAAFVLAILQCFGYDFEKLNGKNIHNLENVVTMEMNVHNRFDKLELWFEKTDIPNQYHPEASFLASSRLFKEVTTFTSSDPALFPLPSPELLALHAMCAKVAHLSGAAEFIDKYDRDLDDLDVLASDGSSSIALDYLTWGRLGTAVDVDVEG